MLRSLRSAILIMALAFVGKAMAVEEPQYIALEKSPPFELRAYQPMILAEVQVAGSLDEASNQGFRLIAAYIFGQNQVNQKIAMTAPVEIESQTVKGAQIAMTAPVGIEKNAEKWTVSFVMPSEYTMETIPTPLNPLVKLRQIPAVKKAAITFSGFYNDQKVEEKTQELELWVKSKNLQAISTARFARYNPPWTLPFLRRNEILMDIRD